MTMIETPASVIETPRFTDGADSRDALLADLLSHVRLSGALYLRGTYTTPWAFESPGNCELVDLLAPGAERLLVFHVVRKGRVRVHSLGHSVEIAAGEMAVLPNADRHIITGPDDAGVSPVPIAEMLPPPPWNDIPVLHAGGDGDASEMICGYFRCDELLFNTVLRRLPPVFAVRPAGRVATLLDAALDYAVEDGSRCGGVTAMDHINELLLTEALRLHADQASDADGWLAASNDPVVGRALKLMHDEPDRDWNAEELARRANTSRSVLGERFKALLGQSPIHYLAEWRMQLAADLLRTTQLKLAAVAERAGYGSEAAFSRAFRRHVGQSPAEWRDKLVVRQ